MYVPLMSVISIVVSGGSMMTRGTVVDARPVNSSENSKRLSERISISTHDLVSPTWNTKLVGGGE